MATEIVRSIFGAERAGQEYDYVVKALTQAHQAGVDEAVGIVEGIRNDEDVRAHQSNDNFKHYAVGVLDRVLKALQDNK